MLISFSYENFRSFKDEKTLNMTAASISECPENVFVASGQKLLKSAAIYGANASGKSNLVLAMKRMRAVVMFSSRESYAKKLLPVKSFQLSDSVADKASKLEVCFIADGVQYRYGFEATEKKIVTEWLLHCRKTKDVPLFFRENDEIEVYKDFGDAEKLKKFTRDSALFLSVCAQFNIATALTIQEWFEQFNFISGEYDRRYRGYTERLLLNDGKKKQAIINLMRQADLAIRDINIEHRDVDIGDLPQKMPQKLKESIVEDGIDDISSKHNIYDDKGNVIDDKFVDFDEWESAGTKKFFNLAGVVVECLAEGEILVIDELDARLHPLLVVQIIKLFNSEITNPNNAQLIFTTHNTHLLSLDLLRRDQIWFAEKDRCEATDLYSLVEYTEEGKKIRKDASFERDYIRGRYGAIPFPGDFQKLWGDGNAE
ncbi:MAG: ATP-binding protein [Victivallaceae bacterium]